MSSGGYSAGHQRHRLLHDALSYNPNLCINVKGGTALYNNLIIWNLNQLWTNSLWDFLTPPW